MSISVSRANRNLAVASVLALALVYVVAGLLLPFHHNHPVDFKNHPECAACVWAANYAFDVAASGSFLLIVWVITAAILLEPSRVEFFLERYFPSRSPPLVPLPSLLV